jgi:hypothetical protein
VNNEDHLGLVAGPAAGHQHDRRRTASLPAGPALAAAPLSVSRTQSDGHRALYVPVRVNRAGTFTLRTGRLESGERIGLAFTSPAALSRTLGPGQEWVNLCDESLRDMLAPLGVGHFRVDPLPLRVAPLPLGRPGADEVSRQPRTRSVPHAHIPVTVAHPDAWATAFRSLSSHYWGRPHRVHLRQLDAAAPGTPDLDAMALTATDTGTRM